MCVCLCACACVRVWARVLSLACLYVRESWDTGTCGFGCRGQRTLRVLVLYYHSSPYSHSTWSLASGQQAFSRLCANGRSCLASSVGASHKGSHRLSHPTSPLRVAKTNPFSLMLCWGILSPQEKKLRSSKLLTGPYMVGEGRIPSAPSR